MKQIIALLILGLMAFAVIPAIVATDVGVGINPDITTEDFPPLIWMCDSRVVYDDATEPGRVSLDGEHLIERLYNYAFEGEQIRWSVLVMDKNGEEKISDVFGTIGSSQGVGNDIEVNCNRDDSVVKRSGNNLKHSCNAMILEERITEFDSETMQGWDCILTVETADSMYGEYWITVEVEDIDGLSNIMVENEYWFLNPVVALSVDGDLTFTDVRPGTYAYSNTLLVENDADDGSGVMLDMFITGTDFYDSSSSGAKCPTTNQLSLSAFRYFATNGAFSTATDLEIDTAGTVVRDVDAEGYVNIEYGIGFNNPSPFYNNAEIIQTPAVPGPYYPSNSLSPGSEMAITFRLLLPEPCNGDFDTGSIFFWGEAI
jgi:hypothetical protein